MNRMILASLRRRPGRAIAMLVGILVATTGFTLLTSSVSTSKLIVAGEVNSHSRGAFDILVRPTASRTALESDRALLRPNFLNNQYGGITLEQWRQIAEVRGVDVAAPVATLGYTPFYGVARFDLTAAVDRNATRQVLRQRQVWKADRGMTVAMDEPQLVYVTKRPLIRPRIGLQQADRQRYSDGTEKTNPCGVGEPWPTWEVQEDGRPEPLCLSAPSRLPGRKSAAVVAQLRDDGRFHFEVFEEEVSDRLNPPVLIMMSFSVAAVDPAAEARLVGLDDAIVSGSYLGSDPGEAADRTRVPALGAASPELDEEVSVRIEQVGVTALAGKDPSTVAVALNENHFRDSTRSQSITSQQIQQSTRDNGALYFSGGLFSRIGRPGPVEYDFQSDGSLRPRVQRPASGSWTDPDAPPPLLWTETAFRRTEMVGEETAARNPAAAIGLAPVGFFDSRMLTRFDAFAQSALETYGADQVVGAGPADQQRLSGQPLAPNSNPGGYVSPPPSFIIPLDRLVALTGEGAPISGVRVRVSDLTGFNPESRERVRRVADDISALTGLDVEVTLGASPSRQTVVLDEGQYGRPELRLSEVWTKKGVAASIVASVDRKSAVLFGLILLVCVLSIGNAVAAAFRDRRREFAVLSCVGWPAWRLSGLVIGEVVLVGVGAGAVSTTAAVPLGEALGVPVTWQQAAWAVPVAVGVALVASVVPASAQTRSRPIAALSTTTVDVSRRGGRPRRSLFSTALANLTRSRGRTLLAVATLAVGVAGLTVLAAVTWSFHGTVTGSFLGDAVSIRVRSVDVIAIIATMLLGLASVADVLYLNIRDRAAEFAILRVVGWSAGMLGRLVMYEGTLIGVLGATSGAVIGISAAALFAGELHATLMMAAMAVAALTVALTAVAATIPALLVQRIPVAAALSDE